MPELNRINQIPQIKNVQFSGNRAPSLSGRNTTENPSQNLNTGKRTSEIPNNEKRTNELHRDPDRSQQLRQQIRGSELSQRKDELRSQVDRTIQSVQPKTVVDHHDKRLVYHNNLTNNINFVPNGKKENNTKETIKTETSYRIKVCEKWEELKDLLLIFEDDYNGIALPEIYRRGNSKLDKAKNFATYEILSAKFRKVEEKLKQHNEEVLSCFSCCDSDLYNKKRDLITQYTISGKDLYVNLIAGFANHYTAINRKTLDSVFFSYENWINYRVWIFEYLKGYKYNNLDQDMGIGYKEMKLLYTEAVSEATLEILNNLKHTVNKYIENMDQYYPVRPDELQIEGKEDEGL